MAEIIKIQDTIVTVAMDDGSTVDVSKTEFQFAIHEEMKISAYRYNRKYYFSSNPKIKEHEPKIPGRTYVSKTPYGLLRLFLGSFGVHQFYAGNTKKGVLTICMAFLILPLIMFAKTFNHSSLHLVLGLLGLAITEFILFQGYLFVTSIMILCKTPNKNGNISISTWKRNNGENTSNTK